MKNDKKILWIDDEIDLLRAHKMFLEERGYSVKGVSSGDEGIKVLGEEVYDLVLLDENMPGKNGIETLQEIKEIDANIPVIMITKNEAEGLMEQAIGMKINDYLLKPVNPLQIYSASKRILESHKIQEGTASKEYLQVFRSIDSSLGPGATHEDWVRIHQDLSYWDLEFGRFSQTGLNQTHADLKTRCNAAFCKFIEENYRDWLNSSQRPILSLDVFDEYVFPQIDGKKDVYLIVIDCMRYDQWLMIEDLLAELYSVKRDFYYSILPTATPYSRNAIFAGLYPSEIKEMYPDYWLEKSKDEESGKNRFESELMNEQLKRKGYDGISSKYIKIYNNEEANDIRRQIDTYTSLNLVAIVINFLDLLSHGRSQNQILREIAPDESAFRSLMRSWFIHSTLFELLQRIARQGSVVVITTDHGSVLCKKAAMVRANKETSTNLRYKFGENINCDSKYCYHVDKPLDLKLPTESPSKNYVFAKEGYYFVYPTSYHKYERQYKDTFQHGGISLEEMIVPCVTLEPK